MSTLPKPKKATTRPRVPLIWVVPLLAGALAAWLFSGEWRNHGDVIEIEFIEAAGVEAGRTKLHYKGVQVGVVDSVALKQDFSGVRMRIQLVRSAGGLARTGSQFWIVRPEIGISGINGIEALVRGVHLGVQPGQGPPARTFRGLEKPPAPEATDLGPSYLLSTDYAGNVIPGAPVYYRDIRIGTVETSRLSADARLALIRIRVLAPYRNLVRVNSKFWNAGGLPIQISLFGGGNTQTSSLQTLVTGAIEFATPDNLDAVAPEGAQFVLHAKPDNDWLEWNPEILINPEETTSDPDQEPATMPQLLNVKKSNTD